MAFPTIDALRESLAQKTVPSEDYTAKMLHPVPRSTVVDRVAFVLEQCKGKRVLELGASGPLHAKIVEVSTQCCGIDRPGSDHVIASGPGWGAYVVGFDLDDVSCQSIPIGLFVGAPDVIVCGETLEHLSNPGWLLTRLHRQWPDVPLLITVPNAYSEAGARHMAQGIENVNRDHVAWYSYWTLHELLRRAGYRIDEFRWYHGDPYDAEGLIVIARGAEG